MAQNLLDNGLVRAALVDDETKRIIADLQTRQKALQVWAWGNGSPEKGVASRLRDLEVMTDRMGKILQKLTEAEQARKDNLNQVKGGVRVVVVILSLLGVGGLSYATVIANLLRQLVSQ